MNYREKATGRIVQAAKGWQDERGGVVVRHPDAWVVCGNKDIELREESAFMAEYEPADDLRCSACGFRVENIPTPDSPGRKAFYCDGCGVVLCGDHAAPFRNREHSQPMRLCPKCVGAVEEFIRGLER